MPAHWLRRAALVWWARETWLPDTPAAHRDHTSPQCKRTSSSYRLAVSTLLWRRRLPDASKSRKIESKLFLDVVVCGCRGQLLILKSCTTVSCRVVFTCGDYGTCTLKLVHAASSSLVLFGPLQSTRTVHLSRVHVGTGTVLCCRKTSQAPQVPHLFVYFRWHLASGYMYMYMRFNAQRGPLLSSAECCCRPLIFL